MNTSEKLTYRAKTVATNTWIYRQPFHVRGTWYMYNSLWDMVPINPKTISQWTGLKDKYGEKIYEGDIVLIDGEQELEYGFNADWNHMAVVKWDEVNTGFYLEVISKKEVKLEEDAYFNYDFFPLRKWADGEWDIEYSIKGNIYDHSKVLEGEYNV